MLKINKDLLIDLVLYNNEQWCVTVTEVNACLVPVAFNDTLNRYEQVETDICGAHGRCVSDEDGGFSCRCEPGYAGIFCRDGWHLLHHLLLLLLLLISLRMDHVIYDVVVCRGRRVCQ